MRPCKVAIPSYEKSVAPCFEAATRIDIRRFDRNGRVVETAAVSCAGCEGIRKVRLLTVHKVDLLVCNGINRVYRDMLRVLGVDVVYNVSGSTAEVFERIIRGEIEASEDEPAAAAPYPDISLEELLEFSRELFIYHGYRVKPGPGEDAFLVDLVARIDCPLCNREVSVAICCGAHTYHTDREVEEFHIETSSFYDARVFVSPAKGKVAEFCREFGIELIDPKTMGPETADKTGGLIPILRIPVRGHERAWNLDAGLGSD